MVNFEQLTASSSLESWLSYLEQAHFIEIDMGLARVQAVAKRLGLLRCAPKIIHVAGTNGKGSTCRVLEKMSLNLGKKVGVFSSPHMLKFNERIRINDIDATDKEITAAFFAIKRESLDISLTYFEYSTLAALYIFKQHQLDLVILEVGLGGRLDATNLSDSDMAIISAIDFDHMNFLGDDLESIGFEKAGVLRQNKIAILGNEARLDSILQHAKQLNCTVYSYDENFNLSLTEQGWLYRFLDLTQIIAPYDYSLNFPANNIACAFSALVLLFEESKNLINFNYIDKIELNGRFSKLSSQNLQKLTAVTKNFSLNNIICDVGHNPHAARYLAKRLAQIKFKNFKGKIYAICGILKDKDAMSILTILNPLIDEWNFIDLTGNRGQTAEQLATLLDEDSHCYSSLKQALNAVLTQANAEDMLLIFGSFYTVCELYELLQ